MSARSKKSSITWYFISFWIILFFVSHNFYFFDKSWWPDMCFCSNDHLFSTGFGCGVRERKINSFDTFAHWKPTVARNSKSLNYSWTVNCRPWRLFITGRYSMLSFPTYLCSVFKAYIYSILSARGCTKGLLNSFLTPSYMLFKETVLLIHT